jgi:hypothetical protein
MKKKMNFFCLLMFVVLIANFVVGVVLGFSDGAQAFMQGWEEGRTHPYTYHHGFWGDASLILLLFVIIFVGLYALACFIRFIRNVNRDQVFTWENVSLLRWSGWGLLGIEVAMILFDAIEGFSFSYIYQEDTSDLIFGVFILIVAEAFAIGLKLKEEQDLTI